MDVSIEGTSRQRGVQTDGFVRLGSERGYAVAMP